MAWASTDVPNWMISAYTFLMMLHLQVKWSKPSSLSFSCFFYRFVYSRVAHSVFVFLQCILKTSTESTEFYKICLFLTILPISYADLLTEFVFVTLNTFYYYKLLSLGRWIMVVWITRRSIGCISHFELQFSTKAKEAIPK